MLTTLQPCTRLRRGCLTRFSTQTTWMLVRRTTHRYVIFRKITNHSCYWLQLDHKKNFVQVEVIRACKSRFDKQLSRVYTRDVYQEYKREYANSTAFLIEPNPDPEVRNGYLVRHEKGAGSFCWAQHAFKVVADKEAGVYECECKQWEHTGKLVATLIPIQLHIKCT